MNSIGMASITAFYHLHREDIRAHRVPMLSSRAFVIDSTLGCWPLCTPNHCPILLAYLSYDDTREVKSLAHRVTQLERFSHIHPAQQHWR